MGGIGDKEFSICTHCLVGERNQSTKRMMRVAV